MAPLAKVPNMKTVAVLGAEEQLGIQPAFYHVGSTPFASQHSVVPQVPPEVVSEVLRAAIDLPAPQHLERVMIEDQDATRSIAT